MIFPVEILWFQLPRGERLTCASTSFEQKRCQTPTARCVPIEIQRYNSVVTGRDCIDLLRGQNVKTHRLPSNRLLAQPLSNLYSGPSGPQRQAKRHRNDRESTPTHSRSYQRTPRNLGQARRHDLFFRRCFLRTRQSDSVDRSASHAYHSSPRTPTRLPLEAGSRRSQALQK